MKFIFFQFSFLIIIFQTYGQTQDSLISEYHTSEDHEIKTGLAYELAKRYIRKNPEMCLSFCREGILLAKQHGNKAGEANLTNIWATLHYFQGNNDSAKVLYDRVLTLSQEVNDTLIGIRARANLGMVAQKTGDYAGAIKVYLDLLPVIEARGDTVFLGSTLSNLGNAYHRLNRYDKNIAYQMEALECFKSKNNLQGIANAHNSMGVSYEMLDSIESAVRAYENSIKIKRLLGDKFGLANALLNLGSMYSSKFKDYKKADEIFSELLIIQSESKNLDGQAIALTNLGTTAYNLEQYQKAINFQTRAFELSSEIDAKEVKFNAAKKLGNAYEATGDYVNALKYYKIYQEEKNETFDQKFTDDLAEMESKYQNERLNRERMEAENKNQILAAEKKQQFIIFSAITGILLVAGVGYFMRRNAMQREQLALQKASEQKRRFNAVIQAEEGERKRIAQELHDGLGQLLSTARLNVSVLEEKINTTDQKYLSNSLKLIDDAVVEVRSISHNMMPNALISSGLEAAIREQVHLINDSGAIKIHLELPEEKIDLEESKAIAMYRIIQEVINNALKYSEADNIWISVKDVHGIYLNIADDGKGFDTSLIHSTSGIGWENIYSRADILNADLDIRSESGRGSEVSLRMAV